MKFFFNTAFRSFFSLLCFQMSTVFSAALTSSVICLISVQKLSSYFSSTSSRTVPIIPIMIRCSAVQASCNKLVSFTERVFANKQRSFFLFSLLSWLEERLFRLQIAPSLTATTPSKTSCLPAIYSTRNSCCLPRWQMPSLPWQPILMVKVYTQLGRYVIVNLQPNGVYKILSTTLEGMKLPSSVWSHTNLLAFTQRASSTTSNQRMHCLFITPLGDELQNDECQMY